MDCFNKVLYRIMASYVYYVFCLTSILNNNIIESSLAQNIYAFHDRSSAAIAFRN